MSVSVSTTAGNQVTVTVDGATQLSFTTQDSSISVVNGETSSISVTNQGPKGDTGATGATGATGPQGPAGTSPNAFTTVSVAGQDDVVADGVDDTLTIAGGSNVTVTTNASSDTITIASTDTNTNLGNSDQTLSAERTVEMSTNRLIFDNSSTEVASIFPQGYIQATGRSIVNGNGSIGGLLNLKDADSSNGVTLRCPNTVASDLTLILPDADGSADHILKTDGSGDLSFRSHRGGTYSYSGYSTSVTKTASFYYQFADASTTSSSSSMIGSFVGQAISHSTYGSKGSLTVNGTSSTDSVTYSITAKITTNVTVIIATLSPAAGQFAPAAQVVTASGSEQTFTLTQSSPTNCLDQGGKEWSLGLQVTLFSSGSVDFCVSDLSITVT